MKDHYPDETKSFRNLPKECPIHYLSYGGILTDICERVKNIRKNKRRERREFLIQKILNVNINYLINDIQEDARKLKEYKSKQWSKGGNSKKHFIQFFMKNDISLKYLEDAYTKQLVGPPNIKEGDFISIKNSYWGNYGIVTRVTKAQVYYMRGSQQIVDYTEIPDFNKHYYNCWGLPDTHEYKISIWKCTKIGEDTDEFKMNRQSDMWNKGIEYRKRKYFWDSNTIFNNIRKPWDYYDYNNDMFKGEVPTHYNNIPEVWILIQDVVKSQNIYNFH